MRIDKKIKKSNNYHEPEAPSENQKKKSEEIKKDKPKESSSDLK